MRVLLILPCNQAVKQGDYRLGRTWKFIEHHIRLWRHHVTLAACECINNMGLCLESEAWQLKGCDNYPAFEKFRKDPSYLPRITEAMASKLKELAPSYDRIVAYVNVKGYYLALKQASSLTHIPIDFVELGHFSPMAFRGCVSKLTDRLAQLLPLDR